MKRQLKILPFIFACLLFVSGCDVAGTGKEAPGAAETSVASSVYQSEYNGLSFSYPSDWTVEEQGVNFTITAPNGYDAAIVLVDATYQMSLYLAGYGDLTSSSEAILYKYANFTANGDVLTSYDPRVELAADGSVSGDALFSFGAGSVSYSGLVGITQHGGRVLIDLHMSGSDTSYTSEQLQSFSMLVLDSLALDHTDVPLEPADLTELGFPAAPVGMNNYYNPATGYFLQYPDGCTALSSPYADTVVIHHEASNSFLIAVNWTDTFNTEYERSGRDLEACYNMFLFEMSDVLSTVFDAQPDFVNFKVQPGGDNGELYRGTFTTSTSNGVQGDSFAEISTRGDYVQGIFYLYGDERDSVYGMQARNAFNAVLDTTMIVYPQL